jgi:exodeoxyribonuclease VII small subunit
VVGGPERNVDNSQDPKEALTFEQIVDQLSSIVTQLEDGELPLEQALMTFERGVALSRMGSKRLDEAERRIEILLDDSETRDSVETRPFDAELGDE